MYSKKAHTQVLLIYGYVHFLIMIYTYAYPHICTNTHPGTLTHTCMNAIKMFALSAQPAAALNRGNRAVFSLLGAKIYKTNL